MTHDLDELAEDLRDRLLAGAGEGPPFRSQRIVAPLPRRAQWRASRGVAPKPARQNTRRTCASVQPRWALGCGTGR